MYEIWAEHGKWKWEICQHLRRFMKERGCAKTSALLPLKPLHKIGRTYSPKQNANPNNLIDNQIAYVNTQHCYKKTKQKQKTNKL